MKPITSSRTLNEFQQLVRESLESHAARKGYNEEGVDGPNLLYEFVKKKIGAGHAMAEVVYKAVEYMKQPRAVLLVKIAAWAFLEWKHLDREGL